MAYWVKTPWWLKMLFPKNIVWKMPHNEHEPTVYITFDDGPHPKATPYALQQLERYGAKATFFCIGKNVAAYRGIYTQIIHEGHEVGNHTHNHLKGWNTNTNTYIQNIEEAATYIHSNIFRPPYGKIKRSQIKRLTKTDRNWKIYMWDVLSADFDMKISSEQCLENVIHNIEPGSIVVFHDSEKTFEHMRYALPHVLEFCRQQQWKVKSLPSI